MRAQHRRLVAARRPRRRGDRRHGERLRRDGQGLRPPAGARPGVRGRRRRAIAELARDPVEVIGAEWKQIAPMIAMDLGAAARSRSTRRARCSTACSSADASRRSCARSGTSSLPVADAHLCCGSAGTYSILQPELASAAAGATSCARSRPTRPDVIATANIGCLTHLASGTQRPVRHWIELLDERMLGSARRHERIADARRAATTRAPTTGTSSRSRRAGWTTTATATSTT